MIRSTPRLLTTRISKLLIDNLETLCLITGTNKRYRIYTTTDESLIEGRWDLDPIEFDTVDDERVKTYLIEFFWLLQIRMISSAGYLCFPIAQAPPLSQLRTLNLDQELSCEVVSF